MSFTFTRVQSFASVQDLGRPGLGHLAIPASGAFDISSHRLANRLVGNASHAATVEMLRANLEFKCEENLVIAVSGAPVDIRINGSMREMNRGLHVASGSSVSIMNVGLGMRTYLAIRGGVASKEVLGSRSFDELSKLGPTPLVAEQSLAVEKLSVSETVQNSGVVAGIDLRSEVPIRVYKGPRWDFFEPGALSQGLFATSAKCNRVGVRLEGEPLHWDTSQRLASEGVALGSIQVPVDGVPLIFGPDHPTTAGYPVIAVVDPRDISKVAQLAPGVKVRFEVL